MSTCTTLVVNKSDFSDTRVETGPVPTPADDEVVFRVDRFALTSNNITYAVAGDFLRYWGFFPAEEGWGKIPVMSYADVIASSHPEVAVGERVFGFFPMSTHHVARVGNVKPAHFEDVGTHREGHAPAYTQFSRTAVDPSYDASREDQRLLLGGLFLTSFLADDAMQEEDDYGAKAFLVSSASSKTSIALAFMLQENKRGEVIGLTSAGNRGFVDTW